jgi:multiple sugar transport system ATP-binding protein
MYDHPNNVFVAGFMGSPSMNFATVELHGGDRVTATLDGIELEIPDALQRYAGLAAHIHSRVVLGLRPAAFALARPDSAATMEVVPLGVESLGDEKHVLFEAPHEHRTDATGEVPVTVDDAGTTLWTAKVGQYADLTIGQPVRLAVDMGAAYLFDAETGVTIPRSAAREPAVAAPRTGSDAGGDGGTGDVTAAGQRRR